MQKSKLKNSKIEFITLDFPPIVGGISRYLYGIASQMPLELVRITTITPPGSQPFDKQQQLEINRLNLPTKWGAFQKQLKFFAPFYFYHLIKKHDINFFLCGQAHFSIMLPSWIISKIRNKPFGIFTYGLDLLYPQTKSYNKAFNRMLKSADLVFADSEKAKRILIQLEIPSEKIHVVYPPVDLPVKQIDDKSVKVLQKKYDLVDKKCILTVGRLVERKGHDMVIRALPKIIQSIPNFHYIIVGKGSNEATLKQLVKNSQLEAYITFAGFIPDEELQLYYAACDAFVMISREIPEKGDVEGFGIVYLEANLMGKPVVAGRSGGVPEAVLHEKTGLLVNPTDSNEIATAIIRLLTDSELSSRLGETGRQRVLQEFNSKTAATKVLSALSLN